MAEDLPAIYASADHPALDRLIAKAVRDDTTPETLRRAARECVEAAPGRFGTGEALLRGR